MVIVIHILEFSDVAMGIWPPIAVTQFFVAPGHSPVCKDKYK